MGIYKMSLKHLVPQNMEVLREFTIWQYVKEIEEPCEKAPNGQH